MDSWYVGLANNLLYMLSTTRVWARMSHGICSIKLCVSTETTDLVNVHVNVLVETMFRHKCILNSYIYIYIYIHVNTCIYIYIYMYTAQRARVDAPPDPEGAGDHDVEGPSEDSNNNNNSDI